MQRRYITVDVFTDRAFGGNPLAVILDAGGLSTAQMQAIASEFNYSETTFVLPPQDPAHDAQVRIFTVNREIPFAGHPNVGTAFVLATQAAKPPARLVFEEKAGLVPVEILIEVARWSVPSSPRRRASRSLHNSPPSRPPPALRFRRRISEPTGIPRKSFRSGCRSWWRSWPRATRCGGPGPTRTHSPARFPATAATRSISIPAMFPPPRPATCRRGCSPGIERPFQDPATGSATAAASRTARRLVGNEDGGVEAAHRAGRRYGAAEPAADPRPKPTALSCPRMSAALACR